MTNGQTLLEEVFDTKEFRNSRGELIRIHSETSREQCQFFEKNYPGKRSSPLYRKSG